MKKYIDLHIHSSYSDGQFSPIEIIGLAKENNVNTISITDHDDFRSVRELQKINYENIRYINGLELSSIIDINGKKKVLHILGYGFDLENLELENRLAEKKNLREEVNKNYLLNMKKELTFLKEYDFEKIIFDKFIRFSRLILECVEKGEYTLEQLNKIKSYLQQNKMIYPNYEFVANEAIKLIKQAGGIPVLAHPYQYKLNLYEEKLLLKLLKELGLEGLEVYHSGDSLDGMELRQKLATEFGLLQSLGSDFHTDYDDFENKIGLGKNKNLCKRNCSILEKLESENKICRK